MIIITQGFHQVQLVLGVTNFNKVKQIIININLEIIYNYIM